MEKMFVILSVGMIFFSISVLTTFIVSTVIYVAVKLLVKVLPGTCEVSSTLLWVLMCCFTPGVMLYFVHFVCTFKDS